MLMTNSAIIPTHEIDLSSLSPKELRAIMPIHEGGDARNFVECRIRDVFVWAIVKGCSDIHLVGKKDRQSPEVTLSVRTSSGLINEVYNGESSKTFETKLFQLTGTPNGATTPSIVSTRFDIFLPSTFATANGLSPIRGQEHYIINVRVEYVRTFDGFCFVCRILDQQKKLSLDSFGFSQALVQSLHRATSEVSGLILVSGPTGSGKTTLLNAILSSINDGKKAICTVENPVEYRLGDGSIKQIQVGGEITFPSALRSILRQDPDIILIGEIRDTETMEIAIQAAQTGHLVLSTIHANSAHETIARALSLCPDRTRDAVRLAEVLKFVAAQRLLPRYEGVMKNRKLTRNEIDWFIVNGVPVPDVFSEVMPTKRCGRYPIVEAIAVNDLIKRKIREQDNANIVGDIYRLACRQPQYESLVGAGMRAVESGLCRLCDCMSSLDINTDAQLHPNVRLTVAAQQNLSLSSISCLIDQRLVARDAGDPWGVDPNSDCFFNLERRATSVPFSHAERRCSRV